MSNPIANNQLEIFEKIGDGGYGLVFKAKLMNNDQLYALKIMDKNLLDDLGLDAIYNELAIHRMISHNNIIQY